MPYKLINLNEGTWIQEHLDALASSLFSLCVLLFNCGIAAGVNRLVVAVAKVFDLAGGSRKVGLWLVSQDLSVCLWGAIGPTLAKA